jgi:RHS repeat-associated protein
MPGLGDRSDRSGRSDGGDPGASDSPGGSGTGQPRDDFRIDAPALSLPRGGGAIRGIDESFTVQPATGTASLTLTLPLSPGRSAMAPQIRLGYDSGAGNGVCGLGWSLDIPAIRRRTDRKLPRYRDRDAATTGDAPDRAPDDVYLVSGGDDLVPAYRWATDHWAPDVTTDGLYAIRRYRPRIESAHARIERITHPVHGAWWRITTRDDVTTLYGLDAASRIADPDDASRIAHWLPALTYDSFGNCIVYHYKPEDLAGVPATLDERNRRLGLARFTNRHLKRIQYGNRVPYAVGDAELYRPPPPAGEFLFEAVFDYGEHHATQPTPDEVPGQLWATRPDPFSTYRTGFEIRTYRLVHRVLMFHRFDELAGGQPCLVRSLDLAYASSGDGSPQPTQLTTLRSATQCGYHVLPDGTYARKAMPPVELDYEPLRWDPTVRTVDAASVADLPAGVDTAAATRWVDLHGEGITGAFIDQGDAWLYAANLGDVDEQHTVQLDRAKLVAPRPSFSGVARGTLRFEDLDADGARQLVIHTAEIQGYFPLGDGAAWLPFRSFPGVLRVDLDDRNLRRLDLDGDGRADLLISEDRAFVWYASDGVRGHQPMQRTAKPSDEERGAAIAFADATQSIYLADMTGDGLTDIVRIRNGEVSYWPNLGYGRFGARVAMANPPVFDRPDQFHPEYLHLADLTGAGVTDLLYLGRGDCRAWLNHSGNAWSDAQVIAPGFPAERPNQIATTDLLGNGTTCLVWSSPLPAHARAPMRYVDLMGGRKPHLLVRYGNGLGKEIELSYKSSTWYYLRDKRDGRPWLTRLPFPVHCVRRIERRDRITGARRTTDYRYRHGYYDRAEREFRGFGMVEQTDAEQFEHWVRSGATNVVEQPLHQPPVVTRTWFHTGAFLDRERLLTQFRDEYWDRELARAGFPAPADEPALPDARVIAAPGIDPSAADRLGADEWRQALRACKGQALRTEVFALDAPVDGATPAERARQLSPFTVATHSWQLCVVQPAISGSRAVFQAVPGEAITWHYDRAIGDPRIEHTLNVRIDELGNVLESAAVVYGRAAPAPGLDPTTAAHQARSWITYQRSEHTADSVAPGRYLLRRPARAAGFELRGLPHTGPLYRITDFVRPGFDAVVDSIDIPYPDKASDPAPGTVTRRLLHDQRTVYWNDALTGPLAPGALGARALPFESYRLAYTPALLADVFGDKVDDAVRIAGHYVQRGDAAWWIPSGRNDYLATGEAIADARARFFQPIGHIDARGARSAIRYLAGYALLIDEIEDAAGNAMRVLEFDLRSLAPRVVRDANFNRSEVIFDELGWVKASARLGKGGDGDSLAGITPWTTPAETAAITALLAATSSAEVTTRAQALAQGSGIRYLCDADRFRASGGALAPVIATIVREQHAAASPVSPVQISLEYTSGTGGVALAKVQAEPATGETALRWLATGRRVVNNKGNPVKEYEPYFAASHGFESPRDAAAIGVTVVRTYDAIDRLIRVDHPDGTFTRRDHTGWSVIDWDRNDTALDSAWYDRRFHRKIDAELIADGKDPSREAEAAARAAEHAGTPRAHHFDALGRAILDVQHAGFDPASLPILVATATALDVEGRAIAVTDARGNLAVASKYDLTGRAPYHASMDSGRRWVLDDVAGEPLRSWDDRGHTLVYGHDDPLHRLTSIRVIGGDGDAPLDHLHERRIYGEGLPGDTALNLRGRLAVRYDTAGRTAHTSYDFKGNLVASERRLTTAHRGAPDWSGADRDALLAVETFTTAATYDALDRPIERTAVDGSVYRPGYNAANLLETVDVTHGATTTRYVTRIDYDEKGRRSRIAFGSGVTVAYTYDRETFRLLRLDSRTLGGDPLQDFRYTYDPVGNLTHAEDRCIPTVWFDNAPITGLATFRYDPLYRLTEATGREHAGQILAGGADNWDDAAFRKTYDPGDALAWRNYTQQYGYDAVGNLTRMQHAAPGGGGWTRDYHHAAANNRLASTEVGGESFAYAHHPTHGYMTAMPHLSVMRWSFRDELAATATQVVATGTPETTWYVYDGDGNRVRKVTERAAPGGDGAVPSVRSERIYLDGCEIFRAYTAGDVTTERRTFHVEDDRQRIAMIERHTISADGPADPRLVRYQGPDHLGSSRLETDETGRVISYEEFHPFGTTSYQAMDAAIAAAGKRYRFTGAERDEESGLAHHGARYYAPWLGRWTAADRHPEKLTGNRYAYAADNPVIQTDLNGMYEEPVHGVTTYRLAVAAGFAPADAFRIAFANAKMDHDPRTDTGGDSVPKSIGHMLDGSAQHYHFPSRAEASARVETAIGGFTGRPDNAALDRLGDATHAYQDVGTDTAPGPHSLGRKDLGPAIGVSGATLTGFAAAGLWGSIQGFSMAKGGTTGGDVAKVFAVIGAVLSAALVLVGLFGVVLGLVIGDAGHGTYETEMHEQSYFLPPYTHITDQAFQNPDKYTTQLNENFAMLQRAAKAYYGKAGPPNPVDPEAAKAAIYEVTHADTSESISALANAPVRGGMSYAAALRKAVKDKVPGAWGPEALDVTEFSDATLERVRQRTGAAAVGPKQFKYVP